MMHDACTSARHGIHTQTRNKPIHRWTQPGSLRRPQKAPYVPRGVAWAMYTQTHTYAPWGCIWAMYTQTHIYAHHAHTHTHVHKLSHMHTCTPCTDTHMHTSSHTRTHAHQGRVLVEGLAVLKVLRHVGGHDGAHDGLPQPALQPNVGVLLRAYTCVGLRASKGCGMGGCGGCRRKGAAHWSRVAALAIAVPVGEGCAHAQCMRARQCLRAAAERSALRGKCVNASLDSQAGMR